MAHKARRNAYPLGKLGYIDEIELITLANIAKTGGNAGMHSRLLSFSWSHENGQMNLRASASNGFRRIYTATADSSIQKERICHFCQAVRSLGTSIVSDI